GTEAGIGYASDLVVDLRNVDDRSYVGAMPGHAERKRFDPAKDQKAILRYRDGADGILEELHIVIEQNIVCNSSTAQTVAVTVDVLGCRVHDNIGAERQRLLQNRSRERIVDDRADVAPASDGRARGDVGDLQQRI